MDLSLHIWGHFEGDYSSQILGYISGGGGGGVYKCSVQFASDRETNNITQKDKQKKRKTIHLKLIKNLSADQNKIEE